MVQIYSDRSPDIVSKKSAQVGFSVEEILRSFHELKYEKRNIIYALPTRDLSKDFVKPKVDPLIESNPQIKNSLGSSSETLKKIGDRFIHFKGAYSETEAISTSADTLVLDEYDRMPSMAIVEMFDSRLQAAKEPRRRRFSNPSQVGFGVDKLYQDSNQYHWMVKCLCGYEWYLDWETDGKCHYVDRQLKEYVCGKCHGIITDDMRRHGRWIAKYPDRDRHGYWISQLMAPWVSARRIVEQYENSNIEFFNNFVLGKAYTPSNMIVDRKAILSACSPGTISKLGVAMGVDQNVSEQIWVAGTSQGIFAHGKTHSWEELEHLKLTWNATVVADPAPYPTHPRILADKYHDFYVCRFKEMTGVDMVQWKGQVVYADRTKLLDIVAQEINECRMLFRENPYALEDYIADWSNLYRTTVEDPDGRSKSKWLKKENKESDYSLATAYFRLALSKTLGGSSELIEPMVMTEGTVTDSYNESGELETTLSESVRETLDSLE
jgi:hypothetical protein